MTKTLIAATMFATLGVSSALAQSCAPRDQIVSVLQQNHQEAPHGAGLTGTTGMVEVFKSDESGSWTILMTSPSGVSCIMAAGTDWLETAPLEKAGIPG